VKAQPWQRAISQQSLKDYVKIQKRFDRELARALQLAANDAAKLIKQLGYSDTFSAQIRRAQYAFHGAELQRIERDLWRSIGSDVRRGMKFSSALSVETNDVIMKFLIKSVGKGRAAIIADSLLAAARNSFELVRARLLNEIPLSKLVYKNEALATKKVQTAINNGLALGKTAKEIAEDVFKFISPKAPGGASYAAMRLGRTELNNAFHTTSIRGYANQPWVRGVQWNLSASHPVDDECNDYAGSDHEGLGAGIYAPENVPGKPHPMCLCYVTAVTASPREFQNELLAGKYNGFLAANGFWSDVF